MSSAPSEIVGQPLRLQTAIDAGRRGLAWLEEARPLHVLAAVVVAEWLITFAVAMTVRHNGWLYYQGGDQLWHYTTSWVMGQGRLPHTAVGYAWAIVLLPFALLGGPNLLGPLPFIILLNVLVLMPVAILSTYGIGVRIGGRLFGYWACLLWLVVPLIGIKYADAGYHQRYTELLLPQSLGLTVMSDFPSMVVSVAAAYFALRAVEEDDPWDAVLAGLLAGVALGIKPSNAPLVVGMALALLWARRWRAIAYSAVGLAPGLVALALWKGRGEGKLPILGSSALGSHVIAAHAAPVLALSLSLHKYIHPSWSFFSMQLDSIREHFWSARVVEWIGIAGTIGLLRRSRPVGLLFGGWLFSTIFVKWTSPGHGTVDDADLLRQTISTIPAALFAIAGVLLLFPRLPQALRRPVPRPWGSHRVRVGLVVALTALFGVIPAALAVGLPLLKNSDTISYYIQPGSLSAPFGVDPSLRPTITRTAGGLHLQWPTLHPLGGAMGYLVLRAPKGQELYCDKTGGGAQCRFVSAIVDTTKLTSFDDQARPGAWDYRIAAVASWVNDPHAGDIYTVGPAVAVTTPK